MRYTSPGVHFVSPGLLQLTVLRHRRRSHEPAAVSNEAARLVSAVGRSTVRPHQVSGTGAALASSSTSGRFQDGHPGLPAGASTPYKRWSKCSMEKVRGRFLQLF